MLPDKQKGYTSRGIGLETHLVELEIIKLLNDIKKTCLCLSNDEENVCPQTQPYLDT